MGDRLLRWYPALLLLALAGLTLWLDHRVQAPPAPRDGSTRHDPDFVVERFQATRMNPDGTQRYAIRGARMTHYPDDGSTRLEQPRFVHFDPGTAPVRVEANTADVAHEGADVHFRGAVRVIREAWPGHPVMTLDTEYLHLQPDADLAQTDQPVLMRQGGTLVRSVGMRFDNRARILKLLSQVKVTYASPLELPGRRRR